MLTCSWRSRAKRQDTPVSTGDAGDYGNSAISKEYGDIDSKTPFLKTGIDSSEQSLILGA
jgi:hypothetical protein